MRKWSEEKKDAAFMLMLVVILICSVLSCFGYVIYYHPEPICTNGISVPVNYEKPNIDWYNVTIDWRTVRDAFKLSDDIYIFETLGWVITVNSTGHVIDYK